MTRPDVKLVYGYQPEWLEQMFALFNKTALKRTDAQKVNRGLMNSQVVASLWQDDRLVATGRMITDFEMYSGIFDVVVDPEFQQCGLGRVIIEALVDKAPDTCIHLTSTFGNEAFYHRLGFRFHKTAMALYPERLSHSPYLDRDTIPS
jgi:GNAT superfamily N-acetyltransferase